MSLDINKFKKLLFLYLPYLIFGLITTNIGEAWRLAEGFNQSKKILSFLETLGIAFLNPLPSLYPFDLFVGIICGVALWMAVHIKGQNAKKFRHKVEYGSARWGTRKDIEPFIASKFEDNIILTKTEFLMMSNRPKNPKNARNKNVLIVGGSGSGKTRFWIKPNLLQMHSSYVVTDPKGSIVIECGNALLRYGYKLKIFNTINFKKSMHYNPFAYIHSEKDILKLVTTLIANTKGDGKEGDEFWTKAETLLYCALIGYIHFEAPIEEQNFSTLIEFINAMEVREDDEDFQNPVDLMFEALERKNPNHFAVRQYKKFKLAAGKTSKSILISCGARLAPFDIDELREITSHHCGPGPYRTDPAVRKSSPPACIPHTAGWGRRQIAWGWHFGNGNKGRDFEYFPQKMPQFFRKSPEYSHFPGGHPHHRRQTAPPHGTPVETNRPARPSAAGPADRRRARKTGLHNILPLIPPDSFSSPAPGSGSTTPAAPAALPTHPDRCAAGSL